MDSDGGDGNRQGIWDEFEAAVFFDSTYLDVFEDTKHVHGGRHIVNTDAALIRQKTIILCNKRFKWRCLKSPSAYW